MDDHSSIPETGATDAPSPFLQPAAVCVEPSITPGLLVAQFEGPALPGMLARYAGLLTLDHLDIVWASILLLPDGNVRHSFEVSSLDARRDADAVRVTLEGLLRSAEHGSLDVESALRAVRSGHEPTREVPVIEFDLDSEISTGIRVKATDRPGLLHDVALAISENGLRTRSISVLSSGGIARDTFRVIDGTGCAPRDPAVLETLHNTLMRVCP